MKETCKAVALVLSIIVIFYLWLHIGDGKQSSLKWQTQEEKSFTAEKQKESKKKVYVVRQDGSELHLAMDDYLRGVIASEMSASFEMEALKAQCVAARTFVIRRGLEVDDTTQTQVYHDDKQLKQIWGASYAKYSKRIKQAVKETSGEILTYQGKPISAVFFSGSCGKTANAEEYWESKTPYLRSVDSHWDKKEKGYEKTVMIDSNTFHTKLGFQNPVSEISEPLRYASGYVKSIKIDGITFSGRSIREKLNLRSSCFTIKKTGDAYRITTKGYGHGLGMSQYGAQGMALEGKSYQEILHHYYTDVKIEKKDV